MSTTPNTKVVDELNHLNEAANQTINHISDKAEEKFVKAKNKLSEVVDCSKQQLIVAKQQITEKTKLAAQSTNDYVHNNPWKAVSIAAGIGLLAGICFKRR